MKSLKKLSFVLAMVWIGGSITQSFAGFETGQTYQGFKLLEKRFVAELNAECLYFQHVKSGARLVKILADDANKTVSIAFKTIPQSDADTPHFMEHSVLNGPSAYPLSERRPGCTAIL